jgi:periplasmic divalent cation tolerance protein
LQQNDKAVLIYSTFPSQDAAEKEGATLVDAGLAACVNIIPGMVSIYVWDGKRHRDAETVMLIKTRRELADRVVEDVRARHPYENPALFVIRMEGGSEAFLDWIRAQTNNPGRPRDAESAATE